MYKKPLNSPTAVLPILIATSVGLIFIASFYGNIQVSANSSSQNNGVCVLDRHTELTKPVSFADCSSIESRSLMKNASYKDDPTDVDLKYQWIFRYLDELTREFKVMFRETSFDERISNFYHIRSFLVMFDTDFFQINLENPESNREFEQNSAGTKVDDQLCGSQLKSMLSQLKELHTVIDNKRLNNQTAPSTALEERHIRLAKVLDAFGRYDSGVFVGRSHFFGSYIQCSGSEMMLDNDELNHRTSSRYCVARLKIDKHLSPHIKSRQKHYMEPKLDFLAGICLPESCHTKSFRQNKKIIQELVDSQFKLPTWLYMEETLEVETIYCFVDDDSYLTKIPISGWLFILFIISWISIVLFATHYKLKFADRLPIEIGRENWFGSLVNALDLSRSWENFKKKKAKDKNHRVQLNVLNPVKVVGCISVVLIHSGLGIASTAMNFPQGIKYYESKSYYFLSLSLLHIIDTFFVISGLMVTYFVVKRFSRREEISKIGVEKKIPFLQQWFSVVLARYLRLLPAYFLVFWFTKSLFRLTGSGPVWDYGSNKLTMVGGCQLETWFSPFILVPAFSHPSRQCMPQAWTVANDLFLCTFLSPLILLLARNPNLAIKTIALLCLSSIGAMVYRMNLLPESLMNDVQEIKVDGMIRIYVNFTDIYIAPYFRAVPFLVGSVTGYLLYKYNQTPKRQWPQWFKNHVTKLSCFFMIILTTTSIVHPLLLKTPLVTQLKYQHWLIWLYLTIFRFFWCVSNSVIFMRMTTDWKHGCFMRAFSGRFWRAMSKLNYGILLVHLNAIMYHLGTGTIAYDYFTINRSMLYLFANYMMSILCALVLHVGFESPIDHLVKLILYSKKRKTDANELNELSISDLRVESSLITNKNADIL